MSSFDRLATTPLETAAPPSPLRERRYGEDRLHLLVRDPRRVLAVWEISEALATRARSSARAAGVPTRYVLTIERADRDREEAVVAARVDLPDAVGGDSWYVDLPGGGGRARARIGLDLGGALEPLLVSRWAPVPPDGPCDEEAPWQVSAEYAAWLAEQGAKARALGLVSSPAGRFPAHGDPTGRNA